MIDQTLGHYRIIEKIGAGGMGEVYRAQDLHLARDVAIKILPAGTLADEQARLRFRKEAEALSKLNHPNIQTVHDFDTQEEVDFLVVEFVLGPTLADKLGAGALPEKEIASLGVQMAAALQEAHERGVVHRDLKPGNIKVTPKGQLKLLDFGLAKLLKPLDATATTESVTETQAVSGTLPYMAPEQLRGEPADARTDIWAAGVVLYEMATGRRPFQAKLSTALAGDIQHQPVIPPGQLNRKISPGLENIILKCLDKNPENRYQSAKELVVDLRRLSAPLVLVPSARRRIFARRWALTAAGVIVVLAVLVGLNVGELRERMLGPGTPKINSLAVLPLENLSGDPEQEYFVEGMHEALIAELSKISALKVISRTSTLRYKGTNESLPHIARELGVQGVIEGSVSREGNQVRISVQLIHGPSDRHLWARSFDRELRGILALHSEVAHAIAREIRARVSPEEQVLLASAPPVNPKAYESYLKGQHHLARRTEEDIKKALWYFEEAVNKEPSSALGYSGLADVHNYLSYFGLVSPLEGRPKAKLAALKSLEIDPNLAEAHVALARVLAEYEWDWAGAEREFKRAIELNPGYAVAHQYFGLYLSWVERHEEAIAEGQKAVELDPLSLPANNSLGARFILARHYDKATEQLQKTLDMEPNYALARLNLGKVYIEKRKYSEGIEECKKAITLAGQVPEYLSELGYAYASAGRKAEAKSILGELKRMSKRTYVSPAAIAKVYAALGERNEAFAWLQRALQERSLSFATPNVEAAWDPMRSDPRFQALLSRMNFPE
jgi:eukaryotic-like serine/threonine-protein kinase